MNMVIVHRDGRGREVTITCRLTAPSFQAVMIPVMVVVVVVMMVRCTRIMNTVACASERQFNENIYFACHTHHRTMTHSVAL